MLASDDSTATREVMSGFRLPERPQHMARVSYMRGRDYLEKNSEQSRIELAREGVPELDFRKQFVTWVQDVVPFLRNDNAGHGEDRAAAR
jgi:hypothetical protein